jgi:hypothetical protein
MIKVFVTGFNKPHAISGTLVSEDERYMILSDNGVNKRILQERIVYIEEFDNVVAAPAPMPIQPAPMPISDREQFVPIAKVEPPSFKDGLQKALKKQREKRVKEAFIPPERASQVEPPVEAPTYNQEDRMMVEVSFSGVKSGKFDVSIPRGVMTGRYSPALGREIFSYPQIKNVLMDGAAVLDGVPTIKENKVFYNTKPTQSAEKSSQEKIQMVGQMIGAGSQIAGLQSAMNSPPKASSNSFSMSKSGFSMPASPFDAVPTIDVDEGESDPDA